MQIRPCGHIPLSVSHQLDPVGNHLSDRRLLNPVNDYHGVYRLENGVYVNALDIEYIQDATKNVNPEDIPPDIPVTPLKDVKESVGN